MSDGLKIMVAALVVATLIGLGIAWDISLWNECRADHSFFYCVRVLS